TDVDAGVAMAARAAALDHAVRGEHGEEAVLTVVDCPNVREQEPIHANEPDSILFEAAHRHVHQGEAIARVSDADAVLRVARVFDGDVAPADELDAGLRDGQRFVIRARTDQDDGAWGGGIDRGLNRAARGDDGGWDAESFGR